MCKNQSHCAYSEKEQDEAIERERKREGEGGRERIVDLSLFHYMCVEEEEREERVERRTDFDSSYAGCRWLSLARGSHTGAFGCGTGGTFKCGSLEGISQTSLSLSLPQSVHPSPSFHIN